MSINGDSLSSVNAISEFEMRLILVVFAFLGLVGVPSGVTAQQQQVVLTYHRTLLGEGDNQLLVLIAYRPPHRDFLALVFDPQDPLGFKGHDFTVDCAARTRSTRTRYFLWDSDHTRARHAEKLELTLERRYGIPLGAFNRFVACDRGHESRSTIVGHQEALAEGRKWQRLNATSAVLNRLSCEQLLQLMSDAMAEYRFSPEFARISERTLAVARSKRCEWSNDFR